MSNEEEQQPTAPVAEAQPPTLTTQELTNKLSQLKAAATQQYSLKNYNAAAESFSEAAEIQDQLNGEMSPENADLLYQYGRCLYHVAVANSDVLGGKVAAGEEPKRKKRKVDKAGASSAQAATNGDGGLIGDAMKDGEQKLAQEVVEAAVEEKDGEPKKEERSSKAYFQITGDENWTDSEDEGEEAADAEAEEEEDDFAVAFEILDVARVLLGRKLESSTKEDEQRQLKERLADTHDLQAEISLENERFHDAIKDTQDALKFKLELYPEESSLIAEAHFKLSLALEFASVTSAPAGEGEDADATPLQQVDEKMRTEAATEMEAAISSCKLRIAAEENKLATLTLPTEISAQQKSIADVKEMVTDMTNRLIDLRNPAVNLSGITGPAGAPDGSDPLKGILGTMLGESKDEQKKRVAEATAGANDLSGLVKHKKKPKADDGANGGGPVVDGQGKRKAEDGDGQGVNGGGGKKVKFEEAT